MHNNDARAFPRVQCGNAHNVNFSLTDQSQNIRTNYCICSDISLSGALFFTDCEFHENQQLMLSIGIDSKKSETLLVTVTRADSKLFDEERFCAAVRFDKSPALFEQLTALAKGSSQSIAA